MRYKVYAYAYEYGWEKYVCSKEEEVKRIINNLDPYEYGQYIVIKGLNDRDEILDSGVIARPKKLKLIKKKNK